MVKKKTNSRISEKKPGRLKIGVRFSLRKLPEQVLKKVIPVNVIHISDQMPGGIKAVVMVVFRNRTGHQVIILKITVKKPCHCGNIPDHA